MDSYDFSAHFFAQIQSVRFLAGQQWTFMVPPELRLTMYVLHNTQSFLTKGNGFQTPHLLKIAHRFLATKAGRFFKTAKMRSPHNERWKIQSGPIIVAQDIPGFCLIDKCVTR